MALTDPALHATWADALEDSYRVHDKLRAASKLLDDNDAAELGHPCLEDLVAVAAVAVAGLGVGRR
jgi:hypothetical protein